jgi:hypothetical protein
LQQFEKLPDRPQEKKYLSPSTRKRNTQRINQWKAKRNEAAGHTKVNARAQTENSNTQIDETAQTDQQDSHDHVLHKPPIVIQRREAIDVYEIS